MIIIIAYIESTMFGCNKTLSAEHKFIVRIGPSIVLFHEGLEGEKERYSLYELSSLLPCNLFSIFLGRCALLLPFLLLLLLYMQENVLYARFSIFFLPNLHQTFPTDVRHCMPLLLFQCQNVRKLCLVWRDKIFLLFC